MGIYIRQPDGTYKELWEVLISKEDIKSYVISDDIYVSNDSEKDTCSTTYEKVKEFTLPSDFPPNTTLRIYFELCSTCPEDAVAYARVYRNDTPVGTERSARYLTSFKEDIDGWNPNDKVQLYAKIPAGICSARVKNFRILGKTASITKFSISVTLS